MWGWKKICIDAQRYSKIIYIYTNIYMHVSQVRLATTTTSLMISSLIIEHYLKPTEKYYSEDLHVS